MTTRYVHRTRENLSFVVIVSILTFPLFVCFPVFQPNVVDIMLPLAFSWGSDIYYGTLFAQCTDPSCWTGSASSVISNSVYTLWFMLCFYGGSALWGYDDCSLADLVPHFSPSNEHNDNELEQDTILSQETILSHNRTLRTFDGKDSSIAAIVQRNGTTVGLFGTFMMYLCNYIAVYMVSHTSHVMSVFYAFVFGVLTVGHCFYGLCRKEDELDSLRRLGKTVEVS